MRVRSKNGSRVISGYAAVFFDRKDPGTTFQLWSDGPLERIMTGAFNRFLETKQDVVAVFDHDPAKLLGRRSSGTLRLSTDEKGLRYDIELVGTRLDEDLAKHIRAGNIQGSSFAFTIAKGGEKWESERSVDYRTLTDLDLFDVGPVTHPAYPATSAGTRSSFEAFKRLEEARTRELDLRYRERECFLLSLRSGV